MVLEIPSIMLFAVQEITSCVVPRSVPTIWTWRIMLYHTAGNASMEASEANKLKHCEPDNWIHFGCDTCREVSYLGFKFDIKVLRAVRNVQKSGKLHAICFKEAVDVEKPRLEVESLCLGRFSVVPGPESIDARDSRQCWWYFQDLVLSRSREHTFIEF